MSYYGLYIPVKSGAAGSSTSGAAGSSNGSISNTASSSALAASSVGVGGGGGGDGGGGGETTSVKSPFVFREKKDALRELKMHKDARLREFNNTEDATKYAETGYEVVQNKYNDVKTSTAAAEKATFRAPTKQELIQFRKDIESGDYERVKSIIWDNPRFLVSSGDTPTALKEGYRYNALHVCAISNKPRIADLILQTVSDPNFVDLLTGKKNDMAMCKELAANLLDYYLNIPEKGRSETPLHLASKNGALEMVEVLTSYPMCRMIQNSEGRLPQEIICTRALGNMKVYEKISRLMQERFYVPVLRSVDNAVPPEIGQPFSAKNPPNLNFDPLSPEVKIHALAGPMSKDEAKKFCRRWKTPPRIGSNTSSPIAQTSYISSPIRSLTPVKVLHANRSFESPKLQRRKLFNAAPSTPHPNKQRAKEPHNGSLDVSTDELNLHEISSNGTSSNADKQNGNHSPDAASDSEPTNASLLQSEANNNEQQEHLKQAPQLSLLKSTLCPRTPIMRQKKEMFFTYREHYESSPIVFDHIEEYHNTSNACERGLYDSPGFKERHIKITDTEKGLEVVGRELAKEQNVEWREYWDFLNTFIDIGSMQGIEKLENFFAQRVRESEVAKKASQAAANSAVMFDDVCSALEKFGFRKDNPGDSMDATRNGFYAQTHSQKTSNTNSVNAPQSTTPYTCVEKSLQVFAKRMTKTILHNIDNIVSINDTFLSELKRLKSLICSFKDDARFLNVNFGKVHARFANLIANYLENSQDVDAETKSKIRKCLAHILLSPGERKEQLHCVCKKIIDFLDTSNILPENLKTEDMCSKAWLAEDDCKCQWDTNLSRKTSRRNRTETRYKNHQLAQHEIAAEKQRVRDVLDEKNKMERVAGNFTEWRTPASYNDSEDDVEDDIFWSDFGGSETEEEEDVWLTPPESLSRLSLVDATQGEKYNIFVYGNEPTKRDLDVLNAILNFPITKTNYPNVYNWKTAVISHYNIDRNSLPTPAEDFKAMLSQSAGGVSDFVLNPFYE